MVKNEIICTIFLLGLSIYSISSIQSGNAQAENWKSYNGPAERFTFLYPPNWAVNSTLYDNGVTQTTLTNPNSSRMKISLIYVPNDPSLNSNTGKPVVLSRVLTGLEDDMAADYFYFNSTGKFPHKYSIQNYTSASDLIDYEKVEGRPGKMLLLISSVSDTDSLMFTFMESKRLFYKQLPVVSNVLKSVTIK